MQIRIQFPDRELEQFKWCKLDDSSVSDAGISDVQELKATCSGAAKITVFLPQKDIFMTSALLPPRAGKQQLNAIAFAVEEKLADDIENCFFATLPQQDDHSVPVAVIDRDLMQRCVSTLAQQFVNASMILPIFYLCPWSDEESLLASVCADGEGYIVRYGRHSALYCHPELVYEVLSLIKKNALSIQNHVEFYTGSTGNEDMPQGLVADVHPSIDLLSQPLSPTVCVNLKQKEYQSSHQWLELLKLWRWPVAAMLLLAVIFFANDLFSLWKKSQTYAELIAEQQALLQQYIPDLDPGDQPKRQLIQLLAEKQAGTGQGGFLDLLHEYSSLKTGFNAISTNRIQYQESQLVVSLESEELRSLESFRNKLSQSRYSAEIQNVNINPDKTTGLLVMRAAE